MSDLPIRQSPSLLQTSTAGISYRHEPCDRYDNFCMYSDKSCKPFGYLLRFALSSLDRALNCLLESQPGMGYLWVASQRSRTRMIWPYPSDSTDPIRSRLVASYCPPQNRSHPLVWIGNLIRLLAQPWILGIPPTVRAPELVVPKVWSNLHP